MDPHSPDPSTASRGARRTRSAAPVPLVQQLHVGISRDPLSTMHVMGVRGLLNATTISTLAIYFMSIADHSSLHLDVTNVIVDDGVVMRRLETLVDQLERRGVHLRVVGFGPHHPAI